MSATLDWPQLSDEVEVNPVHFVYHVPKCAGRTIDRHLASTFPASAYHRIKKRRGLGRFITPYDVTRMPDPRRTKVVGGHFLGVSLDPLFSGRAVKRSILLRDPASHFLSYYNYRMARYVAAGLRPYSIEVAYGATQRNFITHYILRNFLELTWARIACLSDEEKYGLVNAFLATFWFVGDYRFCDDFVAALGAELGISISATPCNTAAELEKSGGWASVTMDLVPARLMARIRAENLVDQRLWETWRDARHEADTVRPRALKGRSSNFIGNEASRLVNQIVRRIQRRWGRFDGLQARVMQGDRAASEPDLDAYRRSYATEDVCM